MERRGIPVKAAVYLKNALGGANAGQIADRDHAAWHRELFGPGVAAGIVRAADLAGYRNGPVHIRRSMHTPPNAEAIRDLMPAFFGLLQRADGAIPDEPDNGFRRIPMDHRSAGTPQGLYVRSGERERGGDIKPFARILAEL